MLSFFNEFEWDPAKAHSNFIKHGVAFERAAQVFLDPLALTIADEEHSTTEARWITLGKDAQAQYLLVVHTHELVDATKARIRIISARKPTRSEILDYEQQL
ncbi:MAG: BrnT family toxin [Bryobacterales bacterium]|nr:BrnT family toxin [Bryobacterales bacterium]